MVFGKKYWEATTILLCSFIQQTCVSTGGLADPSSRLQAEMCEQINENIKEESRFYLY